MNQVFVNGTLLNDDGTDFIFTSRKVLGEMTTGILVLEDGLKKVEQRTGTFPLEATFYFFAPDPADNSIVHYTNILSDKGGIYLFR